ncbi:hypothetical protein OK349_19090 [Sphingomonas sp. BT-65]|uniref:hypothetical protein n=1 Tax=Sphingomonas sp. BT-65 TaxID=2989821 RepID=UPI0022364C7E|nr:hypothetical protein [Sphingomonas sp. BT-65]MCW4463816.1 hypothetical protein [Sphingomonas sp. BT-65]
MSRQDMDLVLSDGINTAVHFIEKSGEFFPFGVVKTNKGEIRHIQAMLEDPRPTSDSVCEVLKVSLREGGIAGDYNTVAIVSHVELTDKETGHMVDAISISIDDKSSSPILCYVPYELNHGVPIIGDIKAGAGSRIAFMN